MSSTDPNYTSEVELEDSRLSHAAPGAETPYYDVASSSQLLPLKRLPEQTQTSLHVGRISLPFARAKWATSWIYEICALVISVTCMVATVIFLKRIDGRPLNDWKLPLSPNTLIAILSTLSKSAILLVITACISQLKWIYFSQRGRRVVDFQTFDDASRGPIGAVSLVFRIRWRATVASLGALLTILALAQDAFYQEIISTYTDRTRQVDDTATLAMTRCQDSGNLDSGYSCKFLLPAVNEH
jgi:hypothetical protein